jgi:hypothetical protein
MQMHATHTSPHPARCNGGRGTAAIGAALTGSGNAVVVSAPVGSAIVAGVGNAIIAFNGSAATVNGSEQGIATRRTRK